MGLVVAPPEKYMGDVGRILYIHVPTAWAALLTCTAAFACALGSLVNRSDRWDATMEACVEVGCVLTAMLLVQGSIWARPTWGVYWDWDPRLTSSAVLLLAYLAVLALRAFVDDPARRAAWSAVATIVAFVDVPIVYFSIKWWRTLHQEFSTPNTVDLGMVVPLRINAVAMILLAIWTVGRRASLSLALRQAEGTATAPPAASDIVAGA
jgi:heme exporter protein C